MKKIFAIILALVMLAGLLTACGGKSGSDAVSVTKEEQLERTGIDLQVMDYCESVEYFVVAGKNGTEIPQITFDWDGVTYCYRAEYTNAAEPYNFSEIDGEWSWTGSGSVGDNGEVPTCSAGGANGSWSAWIRDGIAYVLSCPVEESSVDSIATNLVFPELWVSSDDGTLTELQSSPAELLAGSVLKYDDGEEYLWVVGNKTYVHCSGNRTPDGKLRFWQKLDDNTVELLDENNAAVLTLYAAGSYEDLTVIDNAGRSLSRYDGTLDGTYYCQMTANFYDGEVLYLMYKLPYWVSADEASALEAGSVMNATDHDFTAVTVTAVQPVSDTQMTVTLDDEREYDLTWDADAGAWLVNGDSESWEYIGQCAVTADTVFSGSDYADLGECLNAGKRVYANVTVVGGVATEIEVVSESDM